MAALVAAMSAAPAHAAVIATAARKDGATIRLTDEMPAACNQGSFHGGARIHRGNKVQQACWAFDWKARVFRVVPLAPKPISQGVLQGVARLLDGDQAAAWREVQSRDTLDDAHALRMKANEFKWVDKKAPG
ncbi:hypothetical protein [Noviluteimonas dokdonensis]|uniref:hypothetical protein n=1 Tax=Noviluteimonas dokdonensis TaxID=414050 RepID=UPI0005628341|nr:hypothetical protein [Lysobacter dokdonensis]